MINFLYNAVSSIGAVACKVRLVLKDHEPFGIALTNRSCMLAPCVIFVLDKVR